MTLKHWNFHAWLHRLAVHAHEVAIVLAAELPKISVIVACLILAAFFCVCALQVALAAEA